MTKLVLVERRSVRLASCENMHRPCASTLSHFNEQTQYIVMVPSFPTSKSFVEPVHCGAQLFASSSVCLEILTNQHRPFRRKDLALVVLPGTDEKDKSVASAAPFVRRCL